jgi:competence protein ComEC
MPIVLATVAGVLLAQQLAELPPPAAIIGLSALGLLAWTRERLRLPACLILGFCWAAGFATIRLHESLPSELEGRDLPVEGRVLNLPRKVEDGLRFDLGLEGTDLPRGLPGTIRLHWYRTTAPLKTGERWRLTVRLKRPHGFFNPGGLDYEQWLFAQGIRAVGYVRESADNRRLAPAHGYSPRVWRQSLADRLDAALADDELRGIVKALTLGIEDDIDPAQWEVLRRTGTAHLVAISGSHIGLVAGWSYWLTRRLAARPGLSRWPPPAVAAWLSFGVALFYSALADFALPTQRALIMIALVMGGVALQRQLRPAHTLALALLAVSLFDPLAVVAPGFWLSYGAVALILLAISGRLSPPGFWRGLWEINAVTALGLAPLLLLFFQQVSLISPLANFLAVPLMGLIAVPLCLLGAFLLTLYPPAGVGTLSLTVQLLQPVWRALEWLSALPFAQWLHPSPPAWTLAFALPGIGLLIAPRGIPGRILGAVMLLPALTFSPARPQPGGLRFTLLDVGQGLAAVVDTAAHTLVFDTGARFGPTFDLGGAVIEPFLRQRGVARIDTLVVSHGDNDHIGGAATLLQRFPVRSIYSSVPDRLPQALARTCAAGQSWVWDGVRFDMLSPLTELDKDNDNSCVLKVSTAQDSVLLTGDIELAAELGLAARHGAALASTVLIAPHHGSKTSSSGVFLEKVRPRLVLIPAGYRNRYGFPHPSVLARYREFGARVLNTANAGAISIELPPDGAMRPPASYRHSHGRYWNARPE